MWVKHEPGETLGGADRLFNFKVVKSTANITVLVFENRSERQKVIDETEVQKRIYLTFYVTIKKKQKKVRRTHN